jgi:hypothetical protein
LVANRQDAKDAKDELHLRRPPKTAGVAAPPWFCRLKGRGEAAGLATLASPAEKKPWRPWRLGGSRM